MKLYFFGFFYSIFVIIVTKIDRVVMHTGNGRTAFNSWRAKREGSLCRRFGSVRLSCTDNCLKDRDKVKGAR